MKKNLIGKSHYEVFPKLRERWKEIHQACLKGIDDQSGGRSFERMDGTVSSG